MAYLLVSAVALGASLLTFFTGFGLGTLLLPAFVLFFEPAVAVALTAVVHFLNGLFKFALVGRSADLKVAVRFGLPAFLASFAGAWLLLVLSEAPPLTSWVLAGKVREISAVKLALAALMVLFAVLELSKRLSTVSVPLRYLPLGGLLTGFLGGLSGHQGALRSAFLLRAGLSKQQFIATGVLIAVAVDLSRLSVYVTRLREVSVSEYGTLLAVAVGSAFVGAMAGKRLLEKVTLSGIQKAVAGLLVVVALLLGLGVI
jgi:uncharacterized protein